MSELRLFDIGNQLRELEALAVSDELPAEFIADTIEGLQGDFEIKAVAVAKFVLNLETSAEAIAEASRAMKARADRVQRRADSLRAYLLFQCQAVDVKRIETPELVLKRVNNPPAVQITAEDLIPSMYWYTPPAPASRPDKKSIAAALKNGEKIAGAYLEAGERLEIKI